MGTANNVDTAAQIRGLRALADLIESRPEIGIAMGYELDSIKVYGLNDPDVKTFLASIVRSVSGTPFAVRKDYDGNYFDLTLSAGMDEDKVYGFNVTFAAPRASVCTPKVIGTETVTMPDYTVSMPARPTVEVTRDVIEWECHPLLGE